jgi:hypothetical protein
MPFTPFHMGPGLAIKAMLGRHFSLTVFGITQVAIDIEPLLRMLHGDRLLHGYTHTYLGATAIAVLGFLVGRPLGERLLVAWNRGLAPGWLQLPVASAISAPAAASGAVFGAYSRVLLDSLMHADMGPWAPFSDANGLLQMLPLGEIYLFCLGLGAAGATILSGVFLWKRVPGLSKPS